MGSIIEEILSGEVINCDLEKNSKYYVILFWSPSDIRGIRLANYFSMRKKEFQEGGLSIIGIIVPEAASEKERKYVTWILKHYEINICSVVDNDLYLWTYFNNQFLPNIIIMDQNGNILEESSGSENRGSIEEKIDEIIGVKKTSLGEFWNIHFVEMKYILKSEDFTAESSFKKIVYSNDDNSVTLFGEWILDRSGFPACQGICSISLTGIIKEAFLAIESPRKERVLYDSEGNVMEREIEGFNLISLDIGKTPQLKKVEIKVGKDVKLYSVQF
ncbi:hypothetical protein OXIME_000894 [Oxyplasma meridianum]|uniref:Redoxin domain-containing protein n=1 Tax=Oxyplasma meridianum TaxID=3073602 RepID=A0AAX4NG63_9ARCH